MLADRRILTHPTHGQIGTPLLVPAFSSKGFRLTDSDKLGHEYSEVGYIIDNFPTYEAGSVLISGYDLHFNHFEVPEDRISNDVIEKLATARVMIVDSGGYELTRDFDTSQIKKYQYSPKSSDYAIPEYRSVLDELTTDPHPAPLIITNFDYESRNQPYIEQIEAARELFDRYDDVARTFILKPWGANQERLHLDQLSPKQVKELRGFDAVGVAEKELGASLVQRVEGIAALRESLNDANIDVPIHVWGGLDPVLTPLYYFAGADIFDGLSWLRYGYVGGMAINREASQVLIERLNIRSSKKHVEYHLAAANYQILDKIEIALAQWTDLEGERFDVFEEVYEERVCRRLRSAYNEMKARVPQLRGGV